MLYFHFHKSLRFILTAIILIFISAGMTSGFALQAQGEMTYIVISSNDLDDGQCDIQHCSLREAINAANAHAGLDYIYFDLPTTHTLQLTTVLPTITSPVVIDGTTEPDFAGTPIIELAGTGLGNIHGLTITAGNSTVRGLVINRFGANGIEIKTGGSNVIEGNYIGTDVTGHTDLPNLNGVHIDSSSGNRIGGTTATARNVLSGNTQSGIVIEQSTSQNNLILGNYIGLDATGMFDLGNKSAGIRITNAIKTTIGGTTPAARNVISGNDHNGVSISASGSGTSTTHTIQGNYIGTNYDGTIVISNTSIGISAGGNANLIGGTIGTTPNGPCTGACNLIAGIVGMHVGGVSTVQGNFIGITKDGQARLGTLSKGIELNGNGNTIGGTTPAARNVIVASTDIEIYSSVNKIYGNYLGTDVTGTVVLSGRQGKGIDVSYGEYNQIGSTTGVTVGGACTGACNLISGKSTGIYFYDTADKNTVVGNFIGTDVTGTQAFPNSNGIVINLSFDNTIGGTSTAHRNLISGNIYSGVSITSSSRRNKVLGNLIGATTNGATALPNNIGIRISSDSSSNIIGGTNPNIVVGNTDVGILVETSLSYSGDTIGGNRVGVTSNGLPLGNGGHGIHIKGSGRDNIVGLPNNIIAYNEGAGIYVDGGTGNLLTANEIYSNQGLAIDLHPAGVTPNDSGDSDTGANNSQNYPMLNQAVTLDGEYHITGTLNSAADKTYTLEFFSSDSCDQATSTRAKYLGLLNVTTDSSGNATFAQELPSDYAPYLFATATDDGSNASEFSPCAAVLSPPRDFLVKAVAPHRIDLTWTDNSPLETGYAIERSFNNLGQPNWVLAGEIEAANTDGFDVPNGDDWTQIAVVAANATGYTDVDVVCELPYSYRVRALASGSNTYSGYTPVLTTFTVCELNAPTDLVSTSGETNINLTWVDNAANETAYQIERSTNGGATWNIRQTLDPNTTSTGDYYLTCEHNYAYRVVAVHFNGQTSDYSNVADTETLLCRPSNAQAQLLSDSEIQLTWTIQSVEATHHVIERSIGTSGNWSEVAQVAQSITEYTDQNLACNTAYRYRIRALRTPDFYSLYTATNTVTTPLCPSADLALVQSVDPASGDEGDTLTYMLALTNNGPNPAPAVTVRDLLPAALSFISAAPSQGAYSASSGIWDVGSLNTGQQVTLTITARIKSETYDQNITNVAEVYFSSAADPDSTPANGIVSEDDYTSTVLTVGCTPASVFDVPAGDVLGLMVAISMANNETCHPGSNTITLAPGSVYTLTEGKSIATYGSTGLPAIKSAITIEGNGAVIERSTAVTGKFRLMLVNNSGQLTLNDVTLRNGVAQSPSGGLNLIGYGGGLLNNGGTATLNRVTFDGNQANGYGGGLSNRGTMTVTQSVFFNNRVFQSGYGAAVHNDVTLTLSNSTFTANTSPDSVTSIVQADGGGASMVTLTHNTFAYNSFVYNSLNNGSVIRRSTGTVNLMANLFVGNGADNCYWSLMTSNGYNISDDTTCTAYFTQPTDQNDVDVKVGVLTDNGGNTLSIAPLSDSLVIDRIPSAECALMTDQRGFSRPYDADDDADARCDIGALEVERADLVMTKLVDNPNANVGDAVVFTVQITNNGPSTAQGVVIEDDLPYAISFTSSSATQGAYNPATQLWTVGELPASATATLTINGTMNYGAETQIVNTAALRAAAIFDPNGDAAASAIIDLVCPPTPSFLVASGDVAGLINAIDAANRETCFPGSNTITLESGGLFSLTDMIVGDVESGNLLPVITSDIVIEGQDATIERGIGALSLRFFTIAAGGKLTLNDLTLRGGAAESGGAILNHGVLEVFGGVFDSNIATKFGGAVWNTNDSFPATANFTNVTFSNNRAVVAGAIYNGGTLTIRLSQFNDNAVSGASSRAGAIFNLSDGIGVIEDSSFTGNSVTLIGTSTFSGGGAIGNYGVLTITRSAFIANTTSSVYSNGGAIQNDLETSQLTISESTFEGNKAEHGGAIHFSDGVLNLTTSTFTENTARSDGGALYGYSYLYIDNNTFSKNRADDSGGALAVVAANGNFRHNTFYDNSASFGGAVDDHAVIDYTANLFVKNWPDNCDHVIESAGYNVADDTSCKLSSAKHDISDVEIPLHLLADNGGSTRTHALTADNPALDLIPPAECLLVVDQRGVARPADTGCDAGAYEGFNPLPPLPPGAPIVMNVTTVADTGDGNLSDGEVVDVPLTEIHITFSEPLQDPAGNDASVDVTNPNNYWVITDGANNVFETSGCGMAQGDDALISIGAVIFNASTYTASFTVNNGVALPPENYRLIACGYNALLDLDGNPLDGNDDNIGGDPFVLNFTTDPQYFTTDLVVTQTDNPDPVLIGNNFVYTVTVENTGPNRADAVTLTNTLSEGMTFVSANGTGASCIHNSGAVTCNLGTIPGYTSKTITLEVRADIIRLLSNTATAATATTEIAPDDNTDVVETTQANEPSSQTLVVNTTADGSDGVCGITHCTLREAIEVANALGNTQIITFDLPGTAPFTIQPASPLPALEASITLDGWSQPGFVSSPIVVINGENAGIDTYGLRITGGGSLIRGLVINGFDEDGIYITSPVGNTLVGNYIGTDVTGTLAVGNMKGVYIVDTPDNVIGGSTPQDRNLISGNRDTGLYIKGAAASDNRIQGNYVGTNLTGTAGLPNGGSGIVSSGTNTLVGGTTNTTPGGQCTGVCNLISANLNSGLGISNGGATVQGNFIGTDVTGTVALGNGFGGTNSLRGRGIAISGSPTVTTLVGGDTPEARNLLSGNYTDGINTSTTGGLHSNVIIKGNFIGTDTTGTLSVANKRSGVQLESRGNTVRNNLVSGNTIYGMYALSGSNVIVGNLIGTDLTGTAALSNGAGIYLNADDVQIGGVAPEDRNIISNNNQAGINVANGRRNIIQGNYIGLDVTGTVPMGNGGDGIYLRGRDSKIGGLNPGEGNRIVYSGKSGIYIYTDVQNNTIVGNSLHANGLLGIDLVTALSGTGVTPNDPGDADTGGNSLQNYPIVTEVTRSDGITTINGTLNSTPNTTFRIDFYSSTACDSSGYGEGETYLGGADQTTDANGDVTFAIALAVYVPRTAFITATATSPTGSTSEFSACLTQVVPPGNLLASVVSQTEVQLTWNDNTTDEAGFAVERSSNGINWVEIGTVGPDGVVYNDVGLDCATTYSYRVRAHLEAAEYSAYSNVAQARPCTQQGPVFTVTHTDGTDDLICDITHCTLREAINAANSKAGPQIINLSPAATYSFTLTDNQTGGMNALPAVTGDITINGFGSIIERGTGAGAQFRLFYVSQTGKLTLNDLTLRNGQQTSSNPNGYGGGILNNGGHLTVNRSIITENTALYGAGIAAMQGSSTTVTDSAIVNNLGSYNGGGLINTSTNYQPAGTLAIINTTISGNEAGTGSAVYNSDQGQVSLLHTTIADNYSVNSSLYSNSGFFNVQSSVLMGTPTRAVCYSPAITSQGYNVVSDDSCAFAGTGDRNNTNPMLMPLHLNGGSTPTHAVLPGSPAVDAVPVESCFVDHDQRGITRPLDSNSDGTPACDMGAYERSESLVADLSLAVDIASTMLTGGENITYTLTVINDGPDDAEIVQVNDQVNAQLSFVSANATQGTFDQLTGNWSVGTVMSGSTASLTLTMTVSTEAGQTFDHAAEIMQSSALDLDSMPGNGIGEDDRVALALTIGCPVLSFSIPSGDVDGLITALIAANNETCQPGPDTITLAPGAIYTLTNEVVSDYGLPRIKSDITIVGNQATIERSTAPGTPHFRLFGVNQSASLTLMEITLRNGSSQGVTANAGGAISTAGLLDVRNSTFTGNYAEGWGGAIFVTGNGELLVTDSTFIANTSDHGGAIGLGDGAEAIITRATFDQNVAATNGGAVENRGIVTIIDSQFANNVARTGGVVFNGPEGTLNVTGSTFQANTAQQGSVFYNLLSLLNITNSTLSGNTATGAYPSLIDNSTSTITITHSTLSDNVNSGVIIKNGSGTTRLKAVILSNGAAINCVREDGSIITDGYNLSSDASCIDHLYDATDLHQIDPLLGPLQNNGGLTLTHAPAQNSPVVDLVQVEACSLPTDQRGTVRPLDGNNDGLMACDAGAVEHLYEVIVDPEPETRPMPPVQVSPISGQKVTDVSPLFQWNENTTNDYVTEYRLRIYNTAKALILTSRFETAQLCVAALCSLDISTIGTVLANGQYTWEITAYNAKGNRRSTALAFTVQFPGKALLVKPVNNAVITSYKPTLKWNMVIAASEYRLQIVQNKKTVINRWLTNEEVNCDGSICVVDLKALGRKLKPGAVKWRIHTRNLAIAPNKSTSKWGRFRVRQ